MGQKLSAEIRRRMEQKSTEELRTLWVRHDTTEWSEEAFAAIHDILKEREGTLPEQGELSLEWHLVEKKCHNCGRESADGYGIEAVTNRTRTKKTDQKTMEVTYYDFRPVAAWICADCIRNWNAEKNRNMLPGGLAGFGICLAITVLLGANAQSDSAHFLNLFMLATALLTPIFLGVAVVGAYRRFRPVDYSRNNARDLMPSNEVAFDVFRTAVRKASTWQYEGIRSREEFERDYERKLRPMQIVTGGDEATPTEH
ncbi:MAG: hypothetical protein JXN59_00780 [Anaerolineae bacterium]|nr:hypothetical protein [Anaerolineae bacterium]